MEREKFNIGLVTGGPYEEREISLKSSRLVRESLTDERLQVFTIDIQRDAWIEVESGIPIDKNDFTLEIEKEKIKFDAVYLMLHGSPAEDGKLQGYFDILRIPYTGCNVFVSALTFNKRATKSFLRAYDVPQARSILLTIDEGQETFSESIPYEKIRNLGFPLFIKPNKAGSSYGANKVNKSEGIEEALRDAFQYDDEVLIEEYLDGREFSCGVIAHGGKPVALPITELIPEGEFFDYEAKYLEKSEEITPADLPIGLEKKCRDLSARLYKIIGCEGIVRFDYILKEGEFYLLEVNTIPGLSPTSIVPQEIIAQGLSVHEVLQNVLLRKLRVMNEK